MATRYGLFIDGEYSDGGSHETFADVSPATGTTIAEVALATEADVDRAVRSAHAALAGPWRRMLPAERGACLRRAADGLEARFAEFLKAEVDDTGKPASLARAIDIPRGIANLRTFADFAPTLATESFHQDTPDGRGAMHYTCRRPVGVVAVVCPWNLPLLLMTWKVAPALAAGNAVVVKPSEETPATATLLARVLQEAGVPDGVYNVVHGFGGGSAGEWLCRHRGIGAITFTGETGTGQAIMRGAAESLPKLSFELGGKNPAIVFADADLDEAIRGTARSVFANCGQVCLCSERVYVARAIYEPFLDGLKAAAQALRPGDPWDEQTTIGPLISSTHRERVLSYYDLARREGARIEAGGGVPVLAGDLANGCFIEPTIWSGLDESTRTVREEIFGPCCHVCAFDDEDEVVRLANATDYGLCAAIWTRDLARAHRVALRIEAGLVWINTWFLRDLRTPFGGMKRSGIGREGGRHSMEFYSELKTITVKL